MLGVNKVVLLGWLGQDPELRYTAAQRPVVNVRLATNRYSYDAQGEKKKVVDWHTVIFNDHLAEFCAQKLSKGSKIFVEGMLEYHQRSHREYKSIKWMDALVVAQQLQIIDGMLEHAYPEDFPELAGIDHKQRNSKKPASADNKNTGKNTSVQTIPEIEKSVAASDTAKNLTKESPKPEGDLFGKL